MSIHLATHLFHTNKRPHENQVSTRTKRTKDSSKMLGSQSNPRIMLLTRDKLLSDVSVSHSVESWLFATPWTARLLCPWNSPGKSTGVGSHSLLQRIFPTQGLNPSLLHCRQILYRLSHQGSPSLKPFPRSLLFLLPLSPLIQAPPPFHIDTTALFMFGDSYSTPKILHDFYNLISPKENKGQLDTQHEIQQRCYSIITNQGFNFQQVTPRLINNL